MIIHNLKNSASFASEQLNESLIAIFNNGPMHSIDLIRAKSEFK